MAREGVVMGGSVLFVDDDEGIVRALRRAFRGAPFDTRFAGSGAEALRVLAEAPADLVVTDMRMPEMDGVTLLERVRDLSPGTARVILSGQIDRDTAIRALSTGIARTFFSKPWEDEVLRGRIAHMLEVRAELSAEGLLDVIGGVGHLPAMPSVYTRLTGAIDAGKTLAEIALIIGEDVALSSKTLQVINSALYGMGGVTSVERAIALLGLETVRGIATMTAFVEGESWQPSQKALLDGIVAHSVLVQRFVSSMRAPTPPGEDEGWGIAGLLHDAGKILLLRHLPERYRAVCERVTSGPALDFLAAEKELGFDDSSHARLGGRLLDAWNLPEALVDTALYHHEPERSSPATRTLVEAVAWVNDTLGAASKESRPRRPAPQWLDPGKARSLEEEMNAAVARGSAHGAC